MRFIFLLFAAQLITVHFVFSGAHFDSKACRDVLESEDYKKSALKRNFTSETEFLSGLRALALKRGEAFEKEGYFGPNSMIWEVNRVLFLVFQAGEELYEQLAHPSGAQLVFDHSQLMHEPVPRFSRTFLSLWTMVYGTGKDATDISKMVFKYHSMTVGTMRETAGAYQKGEVISALDPWALLWVHSTHTYGLLRTYETFVRELSLAEKDQYIRECADWGALFGIPLEIQPKSWKQFEQYWRYMLESGELKYTEDALKLERHYRDGVGSGVAATVSKAAIDFMIGATLPSQFARQIGLKNSRAQRLFLGLMKRGLRRGYAWLPDFAKETPDYRLAMARVEGAEADRLDSWLKDGIKLIAVGSKKKSSGRFGVPKK